VSILRTYTLCAEAIVEIEADDEETAKDTALEQAIADSSTLHFEKYLDNTEYTAIIPPQKA
jgi:hypothetical protein